MSKAKNVMQNRAKIIIKLMYIFLLIQPVLDILSNLYNNDILKYNFVTFLKPLFIFGVFAYMFVFIKYEGKLRQFLYYV